MWNSQCLVTVVKHSTAPFCQPLSNILIGHNTLHGTYSMVLMWKWYSCERVVHAVNVLFTPPFNSFKSFANLEWIIGLLWIVKSEMLGAAS